jgi:hypothetical protein
MLSGSTSPKAVHRMLMKLTPYYAFNVLISGFSVCYLITGLSKDVERTSSKR